MDLFVLVGQIWHEIYSKISHYPISSEWLFHVTKDCFELFPCSFAQTNVTTIQVTSKKNTHLWVFKKKKKKTELRLLGQRKSSCFLMTESSVGEHTAALLPVCDLHRAAIDSTGPLILLTAPSSPMKAPAQWPCWLWRWRKMQRVTQKAISHMFYRHNDIQRWMLLQLRGGKTAITWR